MNDKQKYKLQQLCEMLSLSHDTGQESCFPPVSGPVNDGLFEVSPDLITSRCFSSAKSHNDLLYMRSCMQPQILESTGFGSKLHGGHNSSGMKSGTSLCRNSTVKHVRWAGALSIF